jgi:hypothetical protein
MSGEEIHKKNLNRFAGVACSALPSIHGRIKNDRGTRRRILGLPLIFSEFFENVLTKGKQSSSLKLFPQWKGSLKFTLCD